MADSSAGAGFHLRKATTRYVNNRWIWYSMDVLEGHFFTVGYEGDRRLSAAPVMNQPRNTMVVACVCPPPSIAAGALFMGDISALLPIGVCAEIWDSIIPCL